MSKATLLKDLAAKLTDVLPTHMVAIKKDFEKNCKQVLSQTFAKFDVITREEFDTQSKVLTRTRKKLEELEKHIKVMEDLVKKKHK